jgi:hypothetical protein
MSEVKLKLMEVEESDLVLFTLDGRKMVDDDERHHRRPRATQTQWMN